MAASREALGGELRATFTGTLDDETWEQLEEALIFADVGARTTAKVVGELEREAEEGGISVGRAAVQAPARVAGRDRALRRRHRSTSRTRRR